MKNQPLALLLILLAAAGGCSVKVDVADESTTTAEAPLSTITEKSRTAVSLGFLVDRESEPTAVASEKTKTIQPAREPAPQPPTPEPQSRGADDVESSESDRVSVVVVKNVINIFRKDVHRHTHYHYGLPQRSRERVDVRIKVDQKPARDERCERLVEEHLKRVAMWEAMFK